MAKNTKTVTPGKSYNIIAVIPARGGSVGVPLKNIHELNGKPLISYVIRAALGSRHLKRVIVSTDHPKIAEISRECGAEVPFKRPANISEDVPTEFVIQHAVNFVEAEESRKIDIVVTLQATTPLLNSRDIDATIEEVMERNIDSAITVKEVSEFPWWMMEIAGEGLVKPFLIANLSGDVTVRQNLGKLYLPNGAVYATRREVLMTENRIIGQRCGAVIMPRERSVDIDDLLDFKIIETIIREGNARLQANKKMRVGSRPIGEGAPCFIIAEAGVNHNGDIKLARKLIDVAAKAGADAVKFQTFQAKELVTETAEKAEYQKETTGSTESQFEMIRKLELSEKNFKELSNYAQKKGIIFLSTPFDRSSVDFLDKLGMPAFKIGSGEITNLPLLRYIAGKRKPVILSTGMSTLDEVAEAVKALQKEGSGEIALLHCVSCYPARAEDTNLRAMETLRRTFNLPVGLSDHTIGIHIPVAAVALGACIIEKHFTLDKNLPGPDHRSSLEPGELKEMVAAMRDVESALGNGIKRPTEGEEATKKAARRSLVAGVNIPAGTIITGEMLEIKRPGTGLAPNQINTVIGKSARIDIKRDEVVTLDKLSG